MEAFRKRAATLVSAGSSRRDSLAAADRNSSQSPQRERSAITEKDGSELGGTNVNERGEQVQSTTDNSEEWRSGFSHTPVRVLPRKFPIVIVCTHTRARPRLTSPKHGSTAQTTSKTKMIRTQARNWNQRSHRQHMLPNTTICLQYYSLQDSFFGTGMSLEEDTMPSVAQRFLHPDITPERSLLAGDNSRRNQAM